MERIFKIIANWLYYYGRASAGMASFRGSYEAQVPQTLQVKIIAVRLNKETN